MFSTQHDNLGYDAYLYGVECLLSFSTNISLRPLEVFELEDARVFPGQVLIWIPRARSEGSHAAVAGKPLMSCNVLWGIDFIGESSIVLFFAFAVTPFFKSNGDNQEPRNASEEI